MMLHRSEALVGFYGDNLDPEEITARLGAEPTVGVRKGSVWLTSLGVQKIAHTGSWRLEAKTREPADLDGQINELLEGLVNDLAIWRLFANQYRAVIFCGLFLSSGNESLKLRPETLFRIGERGLILDLDIYGQDLPDSLEKT